ncbi:MAG: hypothetical protein WCI55_11825 [Armatimonadota bacterium]
MNFGDVANSSLSKVLETLLQWAPVIGLLLIVQSFRWLLTHVPRMLQGKEDRNGRRIRRGPAARSKPPKPSSSPKRYLAEGQRRFPGYKWSND